MNHRSATAIGGRFTVLASSEENLLTRLCDAPFCCTSKISNRTLLAADGK
jgi:hypothetical protein